MNIFEVLIFAVDSFAIICANTRPCSFNVKNERTVQHARHATAGRRRKQTREAHHRETMGPSSLCRERTSEYAPGFV